MSELVKYSNPNLSEQNRREVVERALAMAELSDTAKHPNINWEQFLRLFQPPVVAALAS